MIDQLTELYNHALSLIKSNPVMSGVFSLWGLTVITFLLKTIPVRIKEFIKNQGTTNLEIDNAGWLNEKIYANCLGWLYSKNSLRFSRNFAIYGVEKQIQNIYQHTAEVGPGIGTHVFFYKRRPLFFTISELESSATANRKLKLRVTKIGRSSQILIDFFNEFKPKPIDDSKIALFSFTGGDGWRRECSIYLRSMNSIALPADFKANILKQIDHFLDNENWFIEKGLAYKLTYILHGVPGTGKTSFIKAIASHYKKNICTLNIHSLTDSSLSKSLSSVPKNSIIVIEDFDSATSTGLRDIEKKGKDSVEKNQDDFVYLSLTGILNSLDGLKSLHSPIIFLTTNCLSTVDPAIYRKGRVDDVFEIKKSEPEDIKVYSEYIFPEYNFDMVEFKSTLGCNLNNALLKSKGDVKKYLKLLQE